MPVFRFPPNRNTPLSEKSLDEWLHIGGRVGLLIAAGHREKNSRHPRRRRRRCRTAILLGGRRRCYFDDIRTSLPGTSTSDTTCVSSPRRQHHDFHNLLFILDTGLDSVGRSS